MGRSKTAENLIRLRGKKTQAEVAEMLGIGQSTYAIYETGERVPRDEMKIKISELYKRSVQSIFFS